MTRWTKAEANAWWATRPFVCGANYLPSSAVNFLEMWHRDGFDAATIDRELGWAAGLGLNAIRINLPYLVWKHDRDGLIDRLDRVMGMAAAQGIDTIPVLFDDCGFGGADATYGPQPDPRAGVHNSRAVASPGRDLIRRPGEWGGFLDYTRDVVATFRSDPRILLWDVYNEPGNRMVFGPEGAHLHEPDFTAESLSLLRDSFAVAREIAPDHPLTTGAWSTPLAGATEAAYETEVDRTALELSDIVTFHAYLPSDRVAAIIDALARRGRPMLCTEWMARPVGSRLADQLPLFRARGVGCLHWGLVQGRTQTWLPWPADLVAAHGGDADRSVWFHDLLTPEGTPYDPAEIALLQRLTQADARVG